MTLDLFAPEDLASPKEYNEAMRNWLAKGEQDGRLRHDSSGEMYEHMWGAWTAWAVGQGIKLTAVTAEDLSAYLQSRGGHGELSHRYAWRLLRLLDRVLALQAAEENSRPNTAAADLIRMRPDIRYANSSGADPLPEYLSAQEAKQLVVFLTTTRPGRVAPGLPWQAVRNRSSVGLILGAGLTPGEIRTLLLIDAVVDHGTRKNVPWKVRVAGSGNSPARETPIAAWAGQLLGHWISIRTEQGIPGAMMFPSTRSTGKPWGKVAQYNAAKEVLQDAGIDAEAGGSFKLRHTFALRQLRRGKTPDEVARWLGVTDPAVMERYLRLVSAPVDLA